MVVNFLQVFSSVLLTGTICSPGLRCSFSNVQYVAFNFTHRGNDNGRVTDLHYIILTLSFIFKYIIGIDSAGFIINTIYTLFYQYMPPHWK